MRFLNWEERHGRLLTRLGIVLGATLAVDLLGTVAIYFLERHVKDTDIHTFFDAFFFTTVQLLTVSSQIKNPFSVGGRILDIFLEIWAVIVVAGSAGAISAFFQDAQSS